MRRTYNSFNSFSRFVPILLVIIITIVTIVAIISISRSIFGGDEQKQQTETTEQKKSDLLQTDEGRAVRMTVRGPLVANEKFRSYQITIAPASRVMTTYEGYVEKQLDTKQLNNNFKAYEELVYALDKRKMMEGRQLSDDQNDLRGICATGKVYKFELLMNGAAIKALWTSDCSGSKGSAVANVEEIVDMFIKQIPDGSKMATSIGLYQRDTLFKF